MLNRWQTGTLYLVIGTFILTGGVECFHALVNWFLSDSFLSLVSSFTFRWCVGWSFIGIGIGLINTRNHREPGKRQQFCFWALHYIGYYFFVLVIVSLASFLAPFLIFRRAWEWKDSSVETLALRVLVALVGGFEGWRLAEHTRNTNLPGK